MKLAKNIYLSKGCVLYDDLAQSLMTLTEDTVGRHHTLAGNCSREIGSQSQTWAFGSATCATTPSTCTKAASSA